MQDFNYYLDKTGEIGYVRRLLHSVVFVEGLPSAKPSEVVIFETGEIGEVISLSSEYVEILLLSNFSVGIDVRVARTDELLKIQVGKSLLGKLLDPLGNLYQGKMEETVGELRPIDITPLGLEVRKKVDKPFETGVTLIDLVMPLGKGQRELIVGDRKTAKTQFLLQTNLTQALKGTICIYAAIAKRRLDLKTIEDYFEKNNILGNSVIIASLADDCAGLVFLTPYAAMTIAEYFRDAGYDVLVTLDDMSAHAKYYREISLLAKRFPGRNSYPGDIFYVHAKLMERAGNYVVSRKDKNGKVVRSEASITCLPVAELVMGDFSGYIQTNLMAMTDGHIYFDKDYYNEGRRPPVNPFLSVTRVGRQAQTPLLRDLSRSLTSFLLRQEKLREYMHFGAELSENTKRILNLGSRILLLFDQNTNIIVPLNASVILLTCLWAGLWQDKKQAELKKVMNKIIVDYSNNADMRKKVDSLISKFSTFSDLVKEVSVSGELFKPY